MKKEFFLLCMIGIWCSCNHQQVVINNENNLPKEEVLVPTFSADSAYHYIAKQVSFGPRVMNSKAHDNCRDYLVNQLSLFVDTVYKQETTLRSWDNQVISICNIIGSINPNEDKRIVLFSHWDSRSYADNDANESNWRKPIDGANDGASGVGVLLEVARQLSLKNARVGVDIIFFDAEDGGVPSFEEYYGDSSETWCLGSQYWSSHPHVRGYKAKYGILLDMVGGKNPVFPKEYFSVTFAGGLVDKIWNEADRLGYSNVFVNTREGGITDDHYFVNTIAQIPTVDIIHYEKGSGFISTWHTQEDVLENIEKSTLQKVGEVLLSIIYKE